MSPAFYTGAVFCEGYFLSLVSSSKVMVASCLPDSFHQPDLVPPLEDNLAHTEFRCSVALAGMKSSVFQSFPYFPPIVLLAQAVRLPAIQRQVTAPEVVCSLPL